MEKIFLIFIVTIIFTSCTESKNEVGAIEETGQILNDYADTLEGSITDAKSAASLINETNSKLLEEIKK